MNAMQREDCESQGFNGVWGWLKKKVDELHKMLPQPMAATFLSMFFMLFVICHCHVSLHTVFFGVALVGNSKITAAAFECREK